MKRNSIYCMFIVFSVLLFSTLPLYAQLADSPWPMFMHDARHTGQSEYAGPSWPALSWSYKTGYDIESSPAIGSDGRVYVGSLDNRLYAVGSGGSLAWTYLTGDYVESSPALGSDGRVYVGSADN
ncbi:MAG: PQQ-binding-like beta-propeller repeat protein, partial [Chlamydiota bacterium]